MKKPNKVCVIGLDAALPKSILKYIDEGVLPNFEKLISGGTIAKNALVPHPTITPPNWTTISNGSWPGTHGITDFHVPEDNGSLELDDLFQAFDRQYSLVENIWEAAERAGKKSIVFNFPCSHNTKLKDGIIVGGNSNIINDWRPKHLPGLAGEFSTCADQIFSTQKIPQGGVKVDVEEAEGWKNLPDSAGDEPLEVRFKLPWRSAAQKMAQTNWYGLLQEGDEGYDSLTLCASKDASDTLCTVKPGQWSDKIRTTVKTEAGEEIQVHFRAKLMELSDDGESLTLYTTGLSAEDGFTTPPEVARELSENAREGDCGIRGGGLKAFATGWIDVDTYMEVSEFQNMYLAESVEYLLTHKEWDLFFMHNHTPDWIYHGFMKKMDPETESDPEVVKKYQDAEKRLYISIDKMLGRIMEAAGKKALFILVSDHGALADGPQPLLGLIFEFVKRGLITLKGDIDIEGIEKPSDLMKDGGIQVDWSKTRAFPSRTVHVYVNLKGRNPEGIVEPGEEYEQVRQEIIDTMMTYVDPKTGKRPYSLALRREDARPLGCYGDRVGDVIYAIYPEFGGQHGPHLPTAEWGVGSIKGLFTLTGPGIKKGLELERTVWLTDLVPTICYLMDYPIPEHAEGAVLYQAFKDPNFKYKDLQKLQEGVERMKIALERQDREPWDKHDCA